jgi:hypothetical protein
MSRRTRSGAALVRVTVLAAVLLLGGVGLARTETPAARRGPGAVTRLPALVFVRDDSLWLREPSGQERQLTRGFEDACPATSPDGRCVVFERRPRGMREERGANLALPPPQPTGVGTELWLLDLSSGYEQRLVRTPGDCFGPSFDPAGARVYFQHVSDYDEGGESWREAVGVAAMRTGKWHDLPRRMIPLRDSGEEYTLTYPRLTLDSRWLVWSDVPHEGGEGKISLARPDGRGERVVSRPRRGHGNKAVSYWRPTPHLRPDRLACLETRIDEVGNAGAGLAIIDLHGRVRWRLRDDALETYSPPPAVAPDGTLAFARYDKVGEEATSVWVVSPPGAHATKLVANAHQPAWVPGRRPR